MWRVVIYTRDHRNGKWNDRLMSVRMRSAMLDTGEEESYLIALWPLSSSKQRANAFIVGAMPPHF